MARSRRRLSNVTCATVIGLTLVVAGDSFFITLFIVILFHQMFEGIALGSRIGAIDAPVPLSIVSHHAADHVSSNETDKSGLPIEQTSTSSISSEQPSFALSKKLGLAALFSFITPLGMAIGIGVLNHFNGNNPSTIVAIGTLDALSAGILVWVGVVEMWAADWMTGAHGQPAELAEADWLTVTLALFGLISGLVVMSVLGLWA
jgi:solute carrier family 39 (zinc transporter), member 1/2/3